MINGELPRVEGERALPYLWLLGGVARTVCGLCVSAVAGRLGCC
jgi:hypothetical protein